MNRRETRSHLKMSNSNENPTLVQTPTCHRMKLRARTPIDYTCRSSNADRSMDVGSCGGLMTGRAPLRTVNSVLSDLGANAARKLRTVKRAWGNFKAKLKPRGRASKRQRLWTVTAVPLNTSSPIDGSRYRAINSPLSPSIYHTPSSHFSRSYRHLISTASSPVSPDTFMYGTPQTDMTPLNLSMVSIDSIGGRHRTLRTPRATPGVSVQGSVKKRATPKRSKKTNRSPGRFLHDLNCVTTEMGKLAHNMQAFQDMDKVFTQTIDKQDSNTTLTEFSIQQATTGQDDSHLGKRTSRRISHLRMRQLEDNGEEASASTKAIVAYNVEQERLV